MQMKISKIPKAAKLVDKISPRLRRWSSIVLLSLFVLADGADIVDLGQSVAGSKSNGVEFCLRSGPKPDNCNIGKMGRLEGICANPDTLTVHWCSEGVRPASGDGKIAMSDLGDIAQRGRAGGSLPGRAAPKPKRSS